MNDLITSVLGFNFNVEIKDQNGELIKTGARTCSLCKSSKTPVAHIQEKKFFTNYNEALLTKIRNFRQIND